MEILSTCLGVRGLFYLNTLDVAQRSISRLVPAEGPSRSGALSESVLRKGRCAAVFPSEAWGMGVYPDTYRRAEDGSPAQEKAAARPLSRENRGKGESTQIIEYFN